MRLSELYAYCCDMHDVGHMALATSRNVSCPTERQTGGSMGLWMIRRFCPPSWPPVVPPVVPPVLASALPPALAPVLAPALHPVLWSTSTIICTV